MGESPKQSLHLTWAPTWLFAASGSVGLVAVVEGGDNKEKVIPFTLRMTRFGRTL